MHTSWDTLPRDIQNQLPLGYPEIRACWRVCKHWRKCAEPKMLEWISQNRYPLERLGLAQRNITIILQRSGNALTYFEQEYPVKSEVLLRVDYCTNLQHLSLENCDLDNAKFLSTISRLSYLTSINLAGNPHVYAEKTYSALTSLKTLNRKNELIAYMGHLPFRESMTSLTELDVCNAIFCDEVGAHILYDLHALKILNISDNRLSDMIIGYLRTSLTSLSIGGNEITLAGLYDISTRLTQLKTLNYAQKEKRPAPLDLATQAMDHHLKNLTNLNLDNNALEEGGFRSIGRMSTLKSLDLSRLSLHDPLHLFKLFSLTQLQHLKLQSCNLSPLNIRITCYNFSSLKSLDLEGNTVGTEVKSIVGLVNNLTSLRLSGPDIDDEAINIITKELTSLSSLEISCSSVTEKTKMEAMKSFKCSGKHLLL